MIRRETPNQPAIRALLAQADARSAALYPAESRHGLDIAALLAADARFFVVREEGIALGCGGYVRLDSMSAEMKRLFVVPDARGRGLATMLIAAIERAAAAEGVTSLFLETGVNSVEALGLYRRLGFVARPPFAAYRPDPLSVFMAKRLG